MPALRVSLVLFFSWACGGCYVASLHGLADASTSVIDDRLVGRWRGVEDDIVLDIARDEWRSYALTVTTASGEQRFTGRLVAIGEAQWFDVTVRGGADADPSVVPVHILGRVRLDDETLAVDLLSHAWFRGRIARGSLTTPAVRDDRDTILLTADRQPLLRFLATQAVSTAMFEEAFTLARDGLFSRDAGSKRGWPGDAGGGP